MKTTMSLTLSIVILCSVVSSCFAKDHSVTWELGVDYSTWGSSRDIKAGDNLIFKYESDDHTVSEVSEEEYKSCTTSKVNPPDQSGRTVFALNNAGTSYFICTVGGHCQSGMRLAVTATGDDQSGTPAPPAGNTPFPPPLTGRGCRKPPPSPGPGARGTTEFSSSATISPSAALFMALLAAAVLVSLL